MKKSLVALAVLAASGAAMAQVSITGNLTAGFQTTTNNNTETTASGFGVDNAEIVFSATEDLGGGLKASAKLGLVNVARGQAAQGINANNNNSVTNQSTGFGPGDSELAISGAFGKLALSSARGTDYLSGGVAGVAGIKMDERVFTERTSTDSISYSVPVGPVTLGLTYSEADNLLGLGVGTSGDKTVNTAFQGTRQVALSAQYVDGPLTVNAGYLTKEKFGTTEHKGRYRASASYDFGVAKLGGGYDRTALQDSVTNEKTTVSDMLLGVSVPVGAVTLGANWAQREVSERINANQNGLRSGYGLKATYALSKRTSVSVDYADWAPAINAKRQNETNVLLSHSF